MTKKSNKDLAKLLNEISFIIKDHSERIRILEEKTEMLFKEIVKINKTIDLLKKQLKEENLIIKDKFNDFDRRIFNIEQKLGRFLEKIDKVATIDDVKKLESYIKIFNPLYGITEYDIRKIVKEELAKLKDGGKK